MSIALRRREVKLAARAFVTDSTEDGRIVEQFFSALDTPKSLAACILFREGEHKQLLDLDVNPDDYLSGSGDLFHRDYLAVSFLSKSDSLKTGYDKKARGLAKFLQMEKQCEATNNRFKLYSELERSEYATWLFVMRRKIDLILGEFDIEEFFDKSSWGPGSTTLLKGPDVSATRKFQSEIGITRDAYALMGSSMAAAYPGWFREEHVSDSSLSIQSGNTVVTVPKNSKIDRVIAIEPGLNLFFQKGIGSMIKRRLLRFGVDLANQGINQSSAMSGSLTGNLATVDFSSASDSIATNLVHKLLPERWFVIMDSLRSKVGNLEGKEFKWEKFSSMGNGFTFELESLIFYAAALATCEMCGEETQLISVYGDDVIIPTGAFYPYEKFCGFLGFTVNSEKSFFSGHFRESCGSHYFEGFDVKPIFHKSRLTDAFSIFKLANSIRRLSHRRNFNCGCDLRFLATWRRILQRLPNTLRSVKIAEGFGDGGILSNFDEACPPRVGFGWEGYEVSSLTQRSVQQSTDCGGLLQERLTQITGTAISSDRRYSHDGLLRDCRRLSNLAYGNSTSLRGRVTIGVSQIVIPQWYDLGAWV